LVTYFLLAQVESIDLRESRKQSSADWHPYPIQVTSVHQFSENSKLEMPRVMATTSILPHGNDLRPHNLKFFNDLIYMIHAKIFPEQS
jgi:hypothetical protein